MAEWWESAPLVAPASANSGGITVGTRKPKEVKTTTVGDSFGVVDEETGEFTPTYTKPPKPGDAPDPEKEALSAAIKGLGIEELLTGVKRARAAVETGRATGLTGAVLGMIPGTTAADFRSEGGYLDQIQGGVIMEKLQALKEASKTGASGMGALSEREGARMAASVAALGPNMSDEALKSSLDDIERHAKVLQAVSDGLDPRDPAVMAKYGIPKLDADIWGTTGADQGPKENTARGAGPAPAELAEMDDAQKRAYSAFWKANPNPSPEQLSTFLDGIGVPGVERAAAENILKGVKSGAGYSTAIDRETILRAEIDAQDRAGTGGDSGAEVLARQGATLGLADEAAGVGRAASRLLQGENPIEGYRLGRDAERLRVEDTRRQMGYGGTAIEIAGSLASANPGGALASVGQLARGGAYGGALAGFGAGEGAEDSLIGAGVGAAGGAAVGGALGAYANRLTPRGMDPRLADAAAAEQVRISQPMIEGNRRAVNRAGVLEADPATAEVIQGGFRNTADDIEGAVIRLGRGGTAQAEEQMGETVQRGARAFIQRSKGVANRLYDRAKTLAGDATVTPRESLTQLQTELQQLSETPSVNQGEIAFINELGEDLARGPLSVDAIRGMRTSIRGRINQQGLTASQADARAMRIMDALQRDAQASLPPAAANAFRRADTFYRERMVHIDDVLDRFIGGQNGIAKLSGQQAFDKIRTLANKDGRRLAAVMRDLTQQERLDVAATLATSIGRNADDTGFQLQKFLDHTTKLSPSARRTIFGPDGAESINRLRMLTQRLQDAQRQVNASKTARPVSTTIRNAARTVVLGLMGGGVGAGSTPAMIAAGTAGAAMLAKAGIRAFSARSLMSPRVSNWLAQTANVNTPAQAQTALRRLGTVIAREPELSVELTPVHRWLTEALTSPATASEPAEGGQ